MIHVIATLDIVADRRDAVLQSFQELTPQVLAEDGCIDYSPSIDVETAIARQAPPREDAITVVERWESIAALEAHLVAPHMQRFRETAGQDIRATTLQILRAV